MRRSPTSPRRSAATSSPATGVNGPSSVSTTSWKSRASSATKPPDCFKHPGPVSFGTGPPASSAGKEPSSPEAVAKAEDLSMLENVPAALGHALSSIRPGLDKLVYAGKELAAPETIRVTSEAFADGEAIPARFTDDGAKISPPLAFT